MLHSGSRLHNNEKCNFAVSKLSVNRRQEERGEDVYWEYSMPVYIILLTEVLLDDICSVSINTKLSLVLVNYGQLCNARFPGLHEQIFLVCTALPAT